MTGRREKNKQKAREKILKAATEIFESKGFEKASVSEIADKADIGVGTVYNYFKSKEDIFVETFSGQMDLETKYDFDVNQLLEKEVVDIVVEYIEKTIKTFKFLPKKLMKELFRISVGSKNNEKLLKSLAELDFKFIIRIEEMLETMKDEGVLSNTFDPRVGAELCYSAYAYEIMMYLFMDDYTIEKVVENSRQKISLLFEGKVKPWRQS